jgi:hypothetical protein
LAPEGFRLCGSLSTLLSLIFAGKSPLQESLRVFTGEVGKTAFDEYTSSSRRSPPVAMQLPPTTIAPPTSTNIPLPSVASGFSKVAADLRQQMESCDRTSIADPDQTYFLIIPLVSSLIDLSHQRRNGISLSKSFDVLNRIELGEIRIYRGQYNVTINEDGYEYNYGSQKGIAPLVFGRERALAAFNLELNFASGPSRYIGPRSWPVCSWIFAELIP